MKDGAGGGEGAGPGPAVRAVGISRRYRSGEEGVQALDAIDLEVRRGEFVSIMGPSGSGKSTLLHLLGLLDRPTSGHLELMGHDASALSSRQAADLRSRTLGFVFQSFHLLPRADALHNVMLPLAIARALALDPPILLADEPTGSLDSKTGAEIMALFADLHKAGKTIVQVTHEPTLARHAQRIIHIRDGRIEAVEELLEDRSVTTPVPHPDRMPRVVGRPAERRAAPPPPPRPAPPPLPAYPGERMPASKRPPSIPTQPRPLPDAVRRALDEARRRP